MGRRKIQDPVSVVKSIDFLNVPLIPSLRPTKDPDIRRKIDTTLREKPGLKNAIKVARQGVKTVKVGRVPERGNPILAIQQRITRLHQRVFQLSMLPSIPIDLPALPNRITLCKKALLRNAADTHIINQHNRNRLINFRPGIPGDSLLHGDSSSQIAGYGDATVFTKDENGMQVKLTIKDVIYIPNFHTNIVSLSRAKLRILALTL